MDSGIWQVDVVMEVIYVDNGEGIWIRMRKRRCCKWEFVIRMGREVTVVVANVVTFCKSKYYGVHALSQVLDNSIDISKLQKLPVPGCRSSRTSVSPQYTRRQITKSQCGTWATCRILSAFLSAPTLDADPIELRCNWMFSMNTIFAHIYYSTLSVSTCAKQGLETEEEKILVVDAFSPGCY